MRSSKKVLGASVALVVLFGLYLASASNQPAVHTGPRPDGLYDNHAYLVDPAQMDLAPVVASFVTLYTKTKFELPNGKMVVHQKMGSGVVLDGRYILTVEHVVAHHGLTVNTPLGEMEFPARKISEETYFDWKGKSHRVRPIYKNQEEDIALLEIPPGIHPPSFPYQLGNSDDLQVGNFLYVVGNPLSVGINVREGIVSATRAPSPVSVKDVILDHAFMVSNGLSPGDSGSPIIAIRDGRYELVGISQGTITVNIRLGWGIRINVIRDLLRTAQAVPQDKWKIPERRGPASEKIRGGAREASLLSSTGAQVERLIGALTSY